MKITINTGFMGHKDARFVELTDGEKSVKIPFETLEKFPLNNTPVFQVSAISAVTFPQLEDLLKAE